MNSPTWIDCGMPAVLDFSGPDAVRFLNGQLTQDLRAVATEGPSLPSCVTDPKGKLQFRGGCPGGGGESIWIDAPSDVADALMQRLTRYLVADDVEVVDLTGRFRLWHWLGSAPETPPKVIARRSRRYGVDGCDWWMPTEVSFAPPAGSKRLEGDVLEDFRIRHGVPAWGRELTEGMLPPEAGLDATDISYHKGCYIGQEVISRIKHAGKVNRRLVSIQIPADVDLGDGRLTGVDASEVGVITSVSPLLVNGVHHALGYLKRGADSIFIGGHQVYPEKVPEQ
ncbi:MAG: YgfZ/GcvT domain-containing protein [Luteolibacter sp.]